MIAGVDVPEPFVACNRSTRLASRLAVTDRLRSMSSTAASVSHFKVVAGEARVACRDACPPPVASVF